MKRHTLRITMATLIGILATGVGAWAEDVVEAYRATYQADELLITVAAIQFDDARLATPTRPFGTRSAARGMTSRIVLGPTVVLVAAGASRGCFEAIENYLRSVR